MNTKQHQTECTGSDPRAESGPLCGEYSLPRLFGIAAIIADTTGHEEDEAWANHFRAADRLAANLIEAAQSAVATLEQFAKLERIPANAKGLRDLRAALSAFGSPQ